MLNPKRNTNYIDPILEKCGLTANDILNFLIRDFQVDQVKSMENGECEQCMLGFDLIEHRPCPKACVKCIDNMKDLSVYGEHFIRLHKDWIDKELPEHID
jgi:hypothetical protein